MAAYAALLSVMNIIHQLNLHPHPPISLHQQQAQLLAANISFLQRFLEAHNSHADLESRIADAAHAAEDAIEGRIFNQICAGCRETSPVEFHQDLQRVIQDMDLIIKEVMEIEDTAGGIQQQLLHRLSSGPPGSAVVGCSAAMVGVDAISIKLLDMLTNGHPGRLAISIAGMGGIGKTTLARNAYENQLVKHHFDVLAWATIAQKSIIEVLLELLFCVEDGRGSMGVLSCSEDELGEKLFRRLYGRRYLITIDDLWDFRVWDKLQRFFPNNKNESRIMITTRLANLALHLCGSHILEMSFLDKNDSWDLLCKNVFDQKESCPLELEETGKTIARNCKGLPLSIVVTGGLLRKIERSPQNWDYIARNLNQIVNLEDEERCLRILHTSYDQLPVHLKPCFLYMAVFPEDSEVRASELIKQWIAEGFLKPIDGKSLEEAGEEYLKELVDRNLVLLRRRSSTGRIMSCKLHDLLRDLCSREADKQKFVRILRRMDDSGGRIIITHRHLCLHQWDQSLQTMEYATPTHSLIWDSCGTFFPLSSAAYNLERFLKRFTDSLNPRLLRVFKVLDMRFIFLSKELKHVYFKDSASKLFNLRYISYPPQVDYSFPPAMCRLWNLQTLIARRTMAVAPPEIWNMPFLRHVQFYSISLPDPPNDVVLENLTTLFTITIWDCCDKVVERIPNIKKIKICQPQLEKWSAHYLNNLNHLQKLETLEIGFASFNQIESPLSLSELTIPRSLVKLALYGTRLSWGEISTKMGSLPLLQVLKLKWDSCVGSEWETFEGHFCSLKFLLIYNCGLVRWNTDSTHFPCLEQLHLGFLTELKEIPLGIGEISTLQLIKLVGCSSSIVVSASGCGGVAIGDGEVASRKAVTGEFQTLTAEYLLRRQGDDRRLTRAGVRPLANGFLS